MTNEKMTPLRERMIEDMRIRGMGDKVRISELPDSDFTNYRTRISLIRGQFCAGWSLA